MRGGPARLIPRGDLLEVILSQFDDLQRELARLHDSRYLWDFHPDGSSTSKSEDDISGWGPRHVLRRRLASPLCCRDKFPHVYKLLGKRGFCVPILGLVDEAEKMHWYGQIGGKPSQVFGATLWASNPDLEAEYCAALTGPGGARALIAAGFCSEQAILSSCGVTSLDKVAACKLTAYCRKDKLSAAVAIASQLDAATAAKIRSVHGLLTALQTLGSAR